MACILISVFGPILLLAAGIWRTYMQNVVRVKPNNIQRVVIENVATGQMKVLGPGAHPLGPGWRELATVQLNREPVTVQKEPVKLSDGVGVEVEYRFDMVSGRPQHPTTGQLGRYDPATGQLAPINPDDRNEVTDAMVIRAVTAINYADREKRILEVMENAMEQVFGHYTSDEILIPKQRPFNVPPQRTPGGLDPRLVTNAATLYQRLSIWIEECANADLVHVGIKVIEVRITNVRPLDPKLQADIEKGRRLEKAKQAAQALIGGSNMTLREGLAYDTPQFGEVTRAESQRELAKAIGQGAKDLANGARNFGKGP